MMPLVFVFKGEEGLSKRWVIVLMGLAALALSLISLACTQVVVPTEEAGAGGLGVNGQGGFLPDFSDPQVQAYAEQVDYIRNQIAEGEEDMERLAHEIAQLQEKIGRVGLESKELVVADQELVSEKVDAAGAAADKGLDRILETAQNLLKVQQEVKRLADKRWDLAVSERDALRAEEARIVQLERVNKETQDNLKVLADAEALSQVRLAMADDVAELVRQEDAFKRESAAAEQAAQQRLDAAEARVKSFQGRYEVANQGRSVAAQSLRELRARLALESDCAPEMYKKLELMLGIPGDPSAQPGGTGYQVSAGVRTHLKLCNGR